MAKSLRPWTVLARGPLRSLDDNLWCIDDDVPGVRVLTRRMIIARCTDGKLVFFNAIPVGDETLAAVRALGTPAHLIIPNRFHTIDAAAFRDKLGLKAYGPPKSIDEVCRNLDVAPYADLPADAAIGIHTVDGFKTGEAVLVVKTGPRASVVVSDLLTNVRHGSGFAGFFFKLLGFTGDAPKLPKPVKMRVLSDAAAVRALLDKLADTPGLARVIPTHGEIIAKAPAAALREIAKTV